MLHRFETEEKLGMYLKETERIWWKEHFPEVPEEVLRHMVGQGEDPMVWTCPWNRRQRRGTSSRKGRGGALVLWGGSIGLDQGELGELSVHLCRHSDGFPIQHTPSWSVGLLVEACRGWLHQGSDRWPTLQDHKPIEKSWTLRDPGVSVEEMMSGGTWITWIPSSWSLSTATAR